MKKFVIIPALLVLCFAVALSGCAPKVHRCGVSGAVTSDGEPVPVGQIQFIPENPDPNVGVVGGFAAITDGRYEIPAKPNGLMPGRYNVRVVATVDYDPDGNPVNPEDVKDGLVNSLTLKHVDLVPPKYGKDSEEYVEIPNAATFTYDINMVKE